MVWYGMVPFLQVALTPSKAHRNEGHPPTNPNTENGAYNKSHMGQNLLVTIGSIFEKFCDAVII